MVTETDELTAVLERAQELWPDETSRSRLLARLALLGGEHLPAPDVDARAARRRAALRRQDDRFRGFFPAGYRERLREEWPP